MNEPTSANGKRVPDYLPLPAEIYQRYPGKHIIFSEDEGRVIGIGDTEDEAYEQAVASGVQGLWHFAYSSPPGAYIL
jgi:Family of unknown function (DUF5678)